MAEGSECLPEKAAWNELWLGSCGWWQKGAVGAHKDD